MSGFDAYLKIDGIEGEATDSKHEKWIQILNYDVDVAMSAVKLAPGGASAGRANLQDFSFTHFIDAASPKLFGAVCKGTHFDKVTVELCRSGGEDKSKFMEYTLSDVMVTSVNCNGVSGELGFPTESVRLNYAQVKMIYHVQKRKGATGSGTVDFAWDRLADKVA